MRTLARHETPGIDGKALAPPVARWIEGVVRSGTRLISGTRLLEVTVGVLLTAWLLGLAAWVWVNFSGWATIP